ncbi:hypothetical protein VSDG_03675 [Cytospora chrysosperma]|uniref:Subtelomeric hrmA-associated cluster protein AFUB-079030/YDR124W-like helical bundle domain-containing protein n=1 Tax=Cytospora chrysosperma TaxID=252740 RepID=A0A423W6G4_CYTCH|nr:hypothetical protein VSDG_03675 [Valsa sordida]
MALDSDTVFQDIYTMLNDYCNIPIHHFIMAGITKEGKLVTFSGPQEAGNGKMLLDRYIDLPGYLQWYTTGSAMPTPSPSYEEGHFGHGSQPRHHMSSAYGGRRQYDRRRTQGLLAYDDDTSYRTRKRQRGGLCGRRDNTVEDDLPAVQVVISKRGIKIGNEEEVWKFCDQRFKNIQQTACKLIAKAWVKLIAPKKQSNHPYTGADAKAPDWWPKPWGASRDERVRHKEPDHLYKPERVHLLNHILRMITDPNHLQHKDIQKQNLNVSKLEEATFEALSAFFGDAENPNNSKKKPYLKEIFKVARYQERFKNGEIDAETEVYVMADDKIPDNYQSDDEDDDVPKDDDDEADQAPTSSTASPPKASDHGLLSTPSTDQSPAGNLHGGPFLGELPVRGHQYHQPTLLQPDLSAGQSSFVEANSMGVNSNQPPLSQAASIPLQETFSDPHASSRRPSLYTSPTEYGSTSASGMYQTWHQTNAPSAPSVYSFNHQHQQQPHQSGSYVDQQPVPLTQTSQFPETASFDSMQRSSYDTAPTSLYRTTSVPQGLAPPHPTQSFPSYLSPHDPRGLPGSSMKIEPLGRGHLHDEGGNSFDYSANKDSNKRWNS